MRTLKISFLIVLVLISSRVYAEPFKSTFEGWHQAYLNYMNGPRSFTRKQKTKIYKVQSVDKKIEVGLNLNSPTAPLVVITPGLYGGYDSFENVLIGQWLFDRGYNVLAIPNAVSIHIVKLGPQYKGMDFNSEAQVGVEIIQQLQNEYHFPKIHFVGSSYGAFLSSIAINKIDPEVRGKIFLLSPPKNILDSLQIMDFHFDDLKAEFPGIHWKHIWLYLKVLWARITLSPITVTPEIARSTLIVEGFHGVFNQLLEKNEDLLTNGPSLSTRLKRFTTEYRNERALLRYFGYLNEYNKNFFDRPQEHEVLYWLEKSGSPWQISTSDDDFIIKKGSWPNSDNIHFYKEGGHVFGYMNRPEFKAKLLEFFPRLH